MDDIIEPFIAPSVLLDANISSGSSWVDIATSHSGNLLADSVEICGGDDGSLPPSSHLLQDVSVSDLEFHEHGDTSSIITNGYLRYEIEKDKSFFHSGHVSQYKLPRPILQSQLLVDGSPENSLVLQELLGCNSTTGSYGLEPNKSSPRVLPRATMPDSSLIDSNSSKLSAFVQSLADAHSASASTIWPLYSNASPFTGDGKSQAFLLHGVECEDVLRKTCAENGKFSQPDLGSPHDHKEFHNCDITSFASGQQMQFANGGLQTPQQEQNGLHNLHLPSFSSGTQMASTQSQGTQTSQQFQQLIGKSTRKNQMNHSSTTEHQIVPANGNGCHGAVKPRVRARRGQATDPHSIAERLRREKISDRMKNLQELVPNSNKTDKASMLDEIIDYVKFLQLQVKVLSMSRLGAAGAVVPLLMESQTEGAASLVLSSPCGGHAGADISELQDSLTFEQEVVKLMESNVTSAMQYLQNKGLCLMPVALASAISNQKGSASTAMAPERRKLDSNPCAISQFNHGCTLVQKEEPSKE